jgi:mono/diheme cytochrome c family protein
MKICDGHTSDIAGKRSRRARFLRRAILIRLVWCFVALAIAAALLVFGTRAMAQSAAPSAKAGETPSGNAENGKKIYAKYGCYECHGREAQGGGISGPRLAPDPLPFSVVLIYVRHPAGDMPPYTDKVVSDKDMTDIYAFLESRPQPPPVNTIPILKH